MQRWCKLRVDFLATFDLGIVKCGVGPVKEINLDLLFTLLYLMSLALSKILRFTSNGSSCQNKVAFSGGATTFLQLSQWKTILFCKLD